jgi:hypothetical protein
MNLYKLIVMYLAVKNGPLGCTITTKEDFRRKDQKTSLKRLTTTIQPVTLRVPDAAAK